MDADAYTISVDGKSVGRIQEHIGGGWFWYASPGGVLTNTAHSTKTLDECKAEVKKAFKEAK